MVARSLPEPLRGALDSRAAVPALLMVGVFLALGAAEGGYHETAFLPAALVALGLLGVCVLTVPTRAAVPRSVLAAAGLLAAYAAWSYLSILWAGNQGAALESANRAVLYAAVFALFALWPMRGLPAATVLGAFGLGIAGLGVVTLLRAMAADDVTTMMIPGRFIEPVGYVNGNAALWFSAFLPCVFLAARREVWSPLRGLALGGAALLTCLAVLGQSRGWLVAVLPTLVAFIALVPGRARNATVLLAVGAAVLVVLNPLLDVFRGVDDGLDPGPLVDDAARASLVMAAALAVGGALAAVADRRIELSGRVALRARVATVVCVGAVVVAAAGVGVAAVGNPVAEASDAWADFKAGSEATAQPTGSSRFTTAAGSNRYDFWRVAFDRFAANPLTGDGAGNFQTAYLREGESPERPQFSHSLELMLLSETGLVGFLILLGGAACGVVAGARAVLGRGPLAAAAAGTAVASFLYWAIHGSVDWFYELPALTAPAFAMLGLAGALAPRRRLDEPRRHGSLTLVGGRLGVAAVVASGLAAILVLGAAWLAQRYVDRAADGWPASPDGALDDLNRASELNPLATEADATAGAIAIRLDRLPEARDAFEAVVDRHPEDAYATLQLGALASVLGDADEARELIRRAAELSPRDPLVDEALADVRAGAQLDPAALYDAALERRADLTGG